MKVNIHFFFKKWQRIVELKKIDEWYENMNEEQLEQEFACENNMDSIYWCWQCKYGCCDIH